MYKPTSSRARPLFSHSLYFCVPRTVPEIFLEFLHLCSNKGRRWRPLGKRLLSLQSSVPHAASANSRSHPRVNLASVHPLLKTASTRTTTTTSTTTRTAKQVQFHFQLYSNASLTSPTANRRPSVGGEGKKLGLETAKLFWNRHNLSWCSQERRLLLGEKTQGPGKHFLSNSCALVLEFEQTAGLWTLMWAWVTMKLARFKLVLPWLWGSWNPTSQLLTPEPVQSESSELATIDFWSSLAHLLATA